MYWFSPKNLISNFQYKRWLGFISKSQWWSEEQLNDFQWASIQKLLHFAYQQVPYYHEVFNRLGAAPDDIRNREDFAKLPFLTKDIIRERLNDLIPRYMNKSRLLLYNTGGSTGTPLSFYKTRRDDIIEKAFMHAQWARVGYHQNDSRVIIRGEVLKDGKLWEINRNSSLMKISAYHLSPDGIPSLVNQINRIRPAFFHVYPTSILLLLELMVEAGLKLTYKPEAILCGSEKLYDYQRKKLESFFNCRVFTWLGLAEQTILAGECEFSNKLHVFSEHSYIELVDENGHVIDHPEVKGEIVGTRLQRNIIPFIRYRSGDISMWAKEDCPCKRHYRLLDGVEGRVQDVVVTSENKKIPVTALFFGQHLQVFEKSIQIQLVQNTLGNVLIRIVKGKNYSDEDEKQLLVNLQLATEGKILFRIEHTDRIEGTSRGKSRFLISNLH